MAAILAAEGIRKHYSDKKLLTDVTLYIQPGDKIGVVGINGTGKTTLLRLIAGLDEPDAGTVTRRNGLTVSCLAQAPDFSAKQTVLEAAMNQISADLSDAAAFEAKAMLTRLGVQDFDADVRTLSGGQKKRVALAAALIRPAELLLLDEPTNHLDAQTIAWLEEKLKSYKGALMMVTHDRYFLDRVCSRIVEIDGGSLYTHEGNYAYYLEKKAEREDMEAASARKRKSILRTELEWLKRGAQARSTKQKARIQRYEEMSAIKGPEQAEKLELGSMATRLGGKIIEAKDVTMAYENGPVLIRDFTYTLLRDDRVGVVGENGCGKTTLLHLLSGEMKPVSGCVHIGETVRIGYFAQELPPVDPDLRLIDYMRSIAEYVLTPDGRLSASQMLERFLFPSQVHYTQLARLSGGEKRRLYLASVLMQAPNVLLLDEPTNDLDIATLEILEEYLDTFAGALVVVSHDRYFLDRVTHRLLCFEEGGRVRQVVSTYEEYAAEREAERKEAEAKSARAAEGEKRERAHALRFSFKEQREYETIDARIEQLEETIKELEAQIEQNASDYVKLAQLMEEKEKTHAALDEAMERWMYLNELAERIAAEKNGK